jgi:hypothetical protein
MTKAEAQKLLDKIIEQVFGYQNPLSLEQFMQKFTFDIRLPQPVTDIMDGSTTWAQSVNPTRFVKMQNARELEIGGASAKTEGLRPARPLNSIEDVMAAWNEINLTTTERYKECLNVSESDNIYYSENVYRSQDIRKSKNILLSDGLAGCEFVAAGQRSGDSTFSIRIEDSGDISNSFNISWSGNITNCFFMHDTGDMQDSMFCTNMKGKRYCIANMQYDEVEYKKLKDIVVRWILTN